MTDVNQILILAVRLGDRGFDRDIMLFCVSDHIASTFELGQELAVFPWCDDVHITHVHVIAELETDLVIAFSRCAMGDVGGAFLAGYFNLGFGDDRSGEGCAEHVSSLVDGIRQQGGEDVVGDQLTSKILDIHLGCTGGQRFFSDRIEIFALSDVCNECDHIEPFVCQPFQDDGGIQTAAICQNDFFLFHIFVPYGRSVQISFKKDKQFVYIYTLIYRNIPNNCEIIRKSMNRYTLIRFQNHLSAFDAINDRSPSLVLIP